MDVVPVFKDQWRTDPFAAEMDKQGNIYGRGAQDMKSISIQYLEAIRRLKNDNIILKRTVHVSFVPDEETGGVEGMAAFINTKEFKDLNIGCGMDEGLSSNDDTFHLFYGEKARWVLRVHCPGPPGHGSLLPKNTVGEKLKNVLHHFYEFRDQEVAKLENNPALTIGDVTSINLTMIEGGVQSNVIPSELIVTFDCRIALTVDLSDFEKKLNSWCKKAGDDVWIEFMQKDPHVPMTKLDDNNAYWTAFKKVLHEMNLKVKPQVLTGTTDGRFVRNKGISVFGFSPNLNTPILVHDNDEYLNKDVFLHGIEIYKNLIKEIGNIEDVTL